MPGRCSPGGEAEGYRPWGAPGRKGAGRLPACYWLGGALVLLLAGCAGQSTPPAETSRYQLQHDRPPEQPVDVSRVPDAVPRWEPRSLAGNRSPYTVWGRAYQVLDSAAGYREQGIASWYGKKFHGYQTSNGEVYDMYAMSAAHKALPLPSYVQVTNLENGRSVVVRVNDRGPFHEERLIDLSYAAAARLDMLRQGTARVEVRALAPPAAGQPKALQQAALPPSEDAALATGPGLRRFLQIGAFSSREKAEAVGQQLRSLELGVPVRIQSTSGTPALYRVQLGPLQRESQMQGVQQQLQQGGFGAPLPVDLP